MKAQKTEIFIFGTGSSAEAAFSKLSKEYRIVGFLDNNASKHGAFFFGIRIFHPSVLLNCKDYGVVIASCYHQEIRNQLVNDFSMRPELISIFVDGSDNHSLYSSLRSRFKRAFLFFCCFSPSQLSRILLGLLFGIRNGIPSARLVPLRWMDNHAKTACTFRSSYSSTTPDIALRRLDRVIFSPVGRNFLIDGATLVVERVPRSDPRNSDYSCGLMIFHTANRAVIWCTDETTEIAPGIIINGGSDLNYYHALVEIIPQLYYLRELPREMQELPIYISSRLLSIPAVSFFLEAYIGIDRITPIDSNCWHRTTELFVVNSPSYMVPRKIRKGLSLNDLYFDDESLHSMRHIAISAAAESPANSRCERVFLARRSINRLYNQDEVIDTVKSFGFTPVYMEDLRFLDQVRIFQGATHILGLAGAAWTNLLFARKGAKCICLCHADCSIFSYLGGLSEVYFVSDHSVTSVSSHLGGRAESLFVDNVKLSSLLEAFGRVGLRQD